MYYILLLHCPTAGWQKPVVFYQNISARDGVLQAFMFQKKCRVCAFGNDKKSVIGEYQTKLLCATYSTSSPAVCADGSYHKYCVTSKGECQREKYCKFLQMTDD